MSRILGGGYVHTLYGTDADVLREVRAGHEPRPRYVSATSFRLPASHAA